MSSNLPFPRLHLAWSRTVGMCIICLSVAPEHEDSEAPVDEPSSDDDSEVDYTSGLECCISY